jgi:osmoprotectant transport system ATP-binding protein
MITFDRVTKRYEDGTLAVEELNLTCATGEITVLVGSSGCGKTTTLRMINRLVEATSGTVTIDGTDVRSSDPVRLRRTIGYVIQSGGLFPHRTVIDNISTVPRLLGTSRDEAHRRAAELMALVGLPPEMATRYASQLSGGQQQRVGVARALAADPPVLLMDEPFSAIDPIVRNELQQDLLDIQSKVRKTIVLVTHDIDEAVKLGDHVAVMRAGGKIAQFDRPEQLLAHPADDFVESFLGLDRGIRRLSFFPAASLTLRTPPTVGKMAPTSDVKAAASAAGVTWVLALDDDRKPLGWVDATAINGAHSGIGPGSLQPVGHTFTPANESLRAALDALVLSPSGLAVAVDSAGVFLGVASDDDLSLAMRGAAGRN